MIGVFNTIKINNVDILRPSNFELKRTDVFAGEYTTMTGATIADRIGWKYSDMSLKWDTLPHDQLMTLAGLSGAVTLEFDDSDGSHSEQIIRGEFGNTATRFTDSNGDALWRDVSVNIRFLNAHPFDESE